MSASLSLYRKYRSQSFDELVGQEPVVRTLKNAIRSGRIAQAYLFTGPRGVGKTSAARLLARAANCLSKPDKHPCNECPNCTAALRDIATDLIEIDAASNTGVDNIREVIEKAQFAPSIWTTKFYIVDEVHMLSTSAFNALLKTLEEPPPHTSFILATTEVHKVPATVASRCQRFDFRRVPLSAMLERLQYVCEQEGIEAEREALELVARQSTGSLRDALSLLDQLRVYAEEGNITLTNVQEMLGASGSREVSDFVDAMAARDLSTGLRQINRLMDEGLDLRQFNRQVVEHLRGLMLIKSGAASVDGVTLDATEETIARMREQAKGASMADLLHWVTEFADADSSLRSTSYRQLPLEMALARAILGPEARPADRSADLAAGVSQIGVAPTARPEAAQERPPSGTREPQQPQRRGVEQAGGPPPPIHSALSIGDMPPPISRSPKSQPEQPQMSEHEPPVQDAPPLQDEDAHSDEDELEKLKRLWPQVIEQINARSKNVAVVFRDSTQVRPSNIQGKICTIAFRYPIHAERSRKEPARGVIEEAISRVMGRPCRVESILFEQEGKDDDEPGDMDMGERPKGNGGPPGRGDPGPNPPPPHETPRGRAAMNIFGITQFDDVE